MKDIEFKFIESNGIKIRLAMMGEGPLVVFCHGWPDHIGGGMGGHSIEGIADVIEKSPVKIFVNDCLS